MGLRPTRAGTKIQSLPLTSRAIAYDQRWGRRDLHNSFKPNNATLLPLCDSPALTRGRIGGGRLSPLFSQQIFTGPLDPPRLDESRFARAELWRESACVIDLVVPAIAQRPLPLRWRCMTPHNRLTRAGYGYQVLSPPVKWVSTYGSVFVTRSVAIAGLKEGLRWQTPLSKFAAGWTCIRARSWPA
jgi:hypothetical protein